MMTCHVALDYSDTRAGRLGSLPLFALVIKRVYHSIERLGYLPSSVPPEGRVLCIARNPLFIIWSYRP